ncbi:MAG: ABC transporter substrate-binding protein [Acidobacteria bacterium]|nr:ABC transporter substrate-binding protein [Acidobacteriota bacterium]
MSKQEITIAHSPDSDDAFMFYALATNKVTSPTLSFQHTLKDIEKLNQEAHEGVWDLTAISFHAYPYVADKYCLMPCGGSMGDGYGPMVVSQRSSMQASDLRGKKIAVPGLLTTAYLVLKIYEPDFKPVVVPFDKILDAVQEGSVDAGLLIHEGQLTYRRQAAHCVLDMGKWWKEKFQLPLPLGGNGIRRTFSPELRAEMARLLHDSVQYALDHRQEALAYAMQFARDLETELADRFVGMYVNSYTLKYGDDGKKGIGKLFDLAFERGLIPNRPAVEY